jgi:hypothetical protein
MQNQITEKGWEMNAIRSAEMNGTRSLESLGAANMRGHAHWTDAPYRWELGGADEVLAVLRREDSQASTARIRRDEHLRTRRRAESMPERKKARAAGGARHGLIDSIASAVKRLLRRR